MASALTMYMPYLSVLPHHKDFDVEKAQTDHMPSPASAYTVLISHKSQHLLGKSALVAG